MGKDDACDASLPSCIASTRDLFHEPIADGSNHARAESNCFQRSLLSGDGSTVITYNQDQVTRAFVLPEDGLGGSETKVQDWTAYSCSRAIHTNATALYPHYNLADPSTTVLLQAHVGLPIRLINALDLSHTHASYLWINASTETWLTPSSLTFSRDGSHFVAGAKERVAVFDLSRDGEGPTIDYKTRAKARARKLFGEAQQPLTGLVSALAISWDGVLATGTTGRQIGLWDGEGMGQQISAFSVYDEDDALRGSGITQLEWSPCSRYLFIAERMSDVLLVYDMRVGKRLCWLQERRAQSMQRMTFTLNKGDGAADVLAGGLDGVVRTWKGVSSVEGGISPSEVFQAHNATVSGAIVHPHERLLVTTSGQRFDPQERVVDDDEEAMGEDKRVGHHTVDNSLKLWRI